jgi:hypothetical protein
VADVSIATWVIPARQASLCCSIHSMTVLELRPLTCANSPPAPLTRDQAGVEPVDPHLHPGVGVDLVAALPAAGLIDAQNGHCRRWPGDGDQQVGVGDERAVRDRPGHAVLPGDIGHRPGVLADRFGGTLPQPGRQPRSGRDARERFGERLPFAPPDFATPLLFAPQQDRDVGSDRHISRAGRHPTFRRAGLLAALRAPPRQLRVRHTLGDPPAVHVQPDVHDVESFDS